MAKDVELRGWTAMIYVADSRDVAGAVRRSQRLHWTLQDGQTEAESWASELGHEIAWHIVDDSTLIGRMPGHFVVVASILLPKGVRRAAPAKKGTQVNRASPA
jgi:hypothetical protein